MKTIIKSSIYSTTGYKIIIIDENEITTEIEINETDPKNEKILKLPENPSNRKWISIDKITKANGELELDYKPTRTIENSSRKRLEDYLTEDERKTIEEIMNRAKERKEADKKPALSKKEKLEEKIKKLQEMIANLESENED